MVMLSKVLVGAAVVLGLILTIWLWLPLLLISFIVSPRRTIKMLRDKRTRQKLSRLPRQSGGRHGRGR